MVEKLPKQTAAWKDADIVTRRKWLKELQQGYYPGSQHDVRVLLLIDDKRTVEKIAGLLHWHKNEVEGACRRLCEAGLIAPKADKVVPDGDLPMLEEPAAVVVAPKMRRARRRVKLPSLPWWAVTWPLERGFKVCLWLLHHGKRAALALWALRTLRPGWTAEHLPDLPARRLRLRGRAYIPRRPVASQAPVPGQGFRKLTLRVLTQTRLPAIPKREQPAEDRQATA